MHLFIEKGLGGGGISTVAAKRIATANNKNCTSYDPLKETIYIIYLHANNLYGFVITTDSSG